MKNTALTGVLAIMALIMTAALDYYVLARGIPAGADSVLVGTIVGAWNAASGMVLSYFFGSSASHDKQVAGPTTTVQTPDKTTTAQPTGPAA